MGKQAFMILGELLWIETAISMSLILEITELSYRPIATKHTPNQEKAFEVDGITGDIFCDEKGRLFISSNKIYYENGHQIDVLD
jgi:hypothetical protein